MTFSVFVTIVKTILPWCFVIGGLFYLFDGGGDFKDPHTIFGSIMIGVAIGYWIIL